MTLTSRARRRLLGAATAGTSLLLAATMLAAPAGAAPADPVAPSVPSTSDPVSAARPGASTGQFAPLNRRSPALRGPRAALRASLQCNGRLRTAHVGQPILLVPGTFSTPEQNYSFNYARAFQRDGRAFCTVDVPRATTGDAQTGAERIVHALRAMHRRSGQKVDVLGFSQGGLLPRFAFRFFPDTRRLVDDFVALAPTNHGTIDADVVCTVPACQPGVFQQRRGSAFIRATNSGQQTFGAIDYTVVFTRTDEVATPNLTNRGTSALPRDSRADVVNVAIQDVCPLDLSEHLLLGTADPTGYALALDAFTHPGVARPRRIDRARVCTQGVHPGVDPVTFPAEFAGYLAAVGRNFAVQPRVVAEPPLRRYVFR